MIEATYCFWLGLGLTLNSFHATKLFIGEHFLAIRIILPLLSGSLIMAGRLYSSFIDLKYEYLFLEKQSGENAAPKANIYSKMQKSSFSDRWYFMLFVNINLLNNQLILLIIAIVFDKPVIFLLTLSLYYIARLIIYFTFYICRAKTRLNK